MIATPVVAKEKCGLVMLTVCKREGLDGSMVTFIVTLMVTLIIPEKGKQKDDPMAPWIISTGDVQKGPVY